MSKFKAGDPVVRKDNTAFSTGEVVKTVKEVMGGIVFFSETNTHMGQNALKHYGQTLQEPIISRASDPKWLPCPPDYKPQDNHEVTYHMGVPTHYYVTESKVMICHEPCMINGKSHVVKGQTRDGKPIGQWVIDMDA